MTRYPIFDGHNDVLLRLWLKKSAKAVSDFTDGESEGQLDLPRMHDGGFAGGLFAIYTPSPDDGVDRSGLNPPPYLPVSQEIAAQATLEMPMYCLPLNAKCPTEVFRCAAALQTFAVLWPWVPLQQ